MIEVAKALRKLDEQAVRIDEIFVAAGCELIRPDMLQPADVFLDRSGENIRQRAYVFTDPGGEELCLRPDLTVPACRVYLARNSGDLKPARYHYRGPAFRYQPGERTDLRPREFEQIGAEFFGDTDRETADADVLALAVNAVITAGLKDFSIHIGDLGLFAALADGIDMAPRWRTRLKHHFWRPRAFRVLLHRLSGEAGDDGEDERNAVLDALGGGSLDTVAGKLAELLEERGIPQIGLRDLGEIAARLRELAEDRTAPPLSADVVAGIEDYLSIDGELRDSLKEVAAIARRLRIDISSAEAAFLRRLELVDERGIDLSNARFTAEFGRNLEYYSGFVFQIERPDEGVMGQIAGGGRYDGLLSDLGAARPVPAAGLAIHTERLLNAVAGKRK